MEARAHICRPFFGSGVSGFFSGQVRLLRSGKHTRSEESAADTRTLASIRLALCSYDVSFGKARPLELRSFKGKANIGPHVFWPSGKCPNLVKSQ